MLQLQRTLFTAFIAGYKLDKQRRLRAKNNDPATERRVFWEITGSGIKNANVTNNPTEIPIAPLIKVMSRACVKMIQIRNGDPDKICHGAPYGSGETEKKDEDKVHVIRF